MSLRKALVFGGGGARGAFEIGVWKALDELGYKPDMIFGTSVGALNAALYLQGNYERASQMWKQIETGDILDYEFPLSMDNFRIYQKTTFNFFLHALKSGGLSAEPLFEKINEYINDENTIRTSGIEFGLTVTDFETRDIIPYYLENIPEGDLPLYLMASASLYPAMEKMYIDGTPYIDGGYKNNIPVDLALEKEADDIIIVDIQGPGLVKDIPKLKQIHYRFIKTHWPLGDLLYFHEKRTETNISLGYLETMKAFDQYEGRWYTLRSQSVKEEQSSFYRFMKKLFAGSYLPEIHDMLTNEANQLQWLKTLKKEWGNRVQREDLPLALAELSGKLFWVSPAEIYKMEELKKSIVSQVVRFKEEEYAQATTQLIPEDFPMTGMEWIKYYKEQVPFISDKRMLFHFYRTLQEDPKQCLSPSNQLLIQLRPLPFLLSLYLFYLETNVENYQADTS